VSTWAGKAGVSGSGGSTVDDARFNSPQGVAIGPDDLLYVTDTGNHTLRRISKAGFVATLAGQAGTPGSSDGVSALFNKPLGIAVNSNGDIFVADSQNRIIRKYVAGGVTTLAGSAGSAGSADGTAGAARFNEPTGLALDPSGNLLVGDSQNHTIRKVSPAGVVTTWAGRAAQYGHVNDVGAAARFESPWGLAADTSGNIYVADWGNASVRKVTSTGNVSSFPVGFGGLPHGVAIDASGNLLVTDPFSCVIRHITPAGVASIIAGQDDDCRVVDGNGTNARLVDPRGITLDALATSS
jgi:streptogramin lyase